VHQVAQSLSSTLKQVTCDQMWTEDITKDIAEELKTVLHTNPTPNGKSEAKTQSPQTSSPGKSFWKRNATKFPGTVAISKISMSAEHIQRPTSPTSEPETNSITANIHRHFSDSEIPNTNTSTSHSAPHSPTTAPHQNNLAAFDENTSSKNTRVQKLLKELQEPVVDLEQLRKLSWQGIPFEVRPTVWQLLLEYLPANVERRETTLERKRREYLDCIPKYFDIDDAERTQEERVLYRQIQIDVPRTHPSFTLFQSEIVQQCLARVLYVWAIRHPASGYVQGINDLATPFFVVFLGQYISDLENCKVEEVPKNVWNIVEADTYWCMTKFLDGIQDWFTFAQPGIQRVVHKLSEIIHRVDVQMFDHFKEQDIQFIQFAFRWMNCLWIRELPLPLVIRIWDTYFAELETFSALHAYACAAFLCRFSEQLRRLDFQDIMLFLKNPPTQNWNFKEIEMILSQAYMWKTLFENAPKHFNIGESQQHM